VILEDTGPNFGCYGEPLVRTPNIDRFASQGIRFTHAFCAAPVCSASRSALMSGRYQTNIGGHNHRTWEWHKKPLVPPSKHICDWFRDAGFFTCNLEPPPGQRKDVNGAAGSGKVDLNFHSNARDRSVFFDGYDWNQRKEGQPFFAHITIIETHKGKGWKIARQRPQSELVDPEKLKLGSYYPDSPIVRDEYANYLDAISLSDGLKRKAWRKIRWSWFQAIMGLCFAGSSSCTTAASTFLSWCGFRTAADQLDLSMIAL